MAYSVETNFILLIWMLSSVIAKGDDPSHLEFLEERWEIGCLLLRFLTQIKLEKKEKTQAKYLSVLFLKNEIWKLFYILNSYTFMFE